MCKHDLDLEFFRFLNHVFPMILISKSNSCCIMSKACGGREGGKEEIKKRKEKEKEKIEEER